SNASLGAVHAMAHSLGGIADMAHGEANAILLAKVIDYNFHAVPERYRDIARAFGLATDGAPPDEVHHMLVEEVVRLGRAAGITDTLGTLGVTRDRIPDLAQKALNDACMATNPRLPEPGDIERLYESAL
ncbi:MAG TPA: iron-containing alcohol dehydrogenase, partial [Verrucomicrobiae bacterium]|nr:iron-containing alcohol dehydrogenase [Verrucomicrobiae bacterium]